MLDLRILKDHWTSEGAREVFALLVTQCVSHEYGNGHSVRPNPGDEGIDTVVGDFGEAGLRVWQAKFFPDGIGDSQRSQIRGSFKACMDGSQGKNVALWTLCIPHEMSIEERTWWDAWRKKMQKDHDIRIELWDRAEFTRFYAMPRVRPVFDVALGRRGAESVSAAMTAMRAYVAPRLAALPPGEDTYRDAIFVRKLEAANVTAHKAARIAFYNFELVRTYVDEAQVPGDRAALDDLLARVLDTWETEFNECSEGDYGPRLYARVKRQLSADAPGAAEATLELGSIHKVGAIHYWADLCAAGWVRDHKIGLATHDPTSDTTKTDDELCARPGPAPVGNLGND